MKTKSTLQLPLGTPLNRSHPAAQGLVGCWMLNEGGGLKAFDSTGLNKIPGVLGGGAVFKQSAQGPCVWFNDDTQFIGMLTPANYPYLNLPGPLTIIASINTFEVTNDTASIISDCASAGSLGQWGLQINNPGGTLSFFQANTLIAITGVVLVANQWYRVGATRSGTTGSWSIKLYVDGRLESTTASAVNPSAQGGAAIGRRGNVTTATLIYFMGLINKVYIYNRVLSDSEMRADYVNPLAMFQGRRSLKLA